MQNLNKLFLGVGLVLGVIGFGVQNAFALSCMQTTLEEDIRKAEVVLVGEVVNIFEPSVVTSAPVSSSGYGNVVIFPERNTTDSYLLVSVQESLKGNLRYVNGNQVAVHGIYSWNGLPGGNLFFKQGQKYILFGNYRDGKLFASLDCGRTAVYTQDFYSQIKSVLGGGTGGGNTGPHCNYTNLNSNLWQGNIYNNRNEVRILQNFLFNYYGVADELNPTGFFGRLTKNYVTQFQNEFGLRATGGVGSITRSKMKEICGQGGGGNGGGNNGQAPNNCKIWYDGCNTCSRQYAGGPMMCTLMSCIQNSGAFCRESF